MQQDIITSEKRRTITIESIIIVVSYASFWFSASSYCSSSSSRMLYISIYVSSSILILDRSDLSCSLISSSLILYSSESLSASSLSASACRSASFSIKACSNISRWASYSAYRRSCSIYASCWAWSILNNSN